MSEGKVRVRVIEMEGDAEELRHLLSGGSSAFTPSVPQLVEAEAVEPDESDDDSVVEASAAEPAAPKSRSQGWCEECQAGYASAKHREHKRRLEGKT